MHKTKRERDKIINLRGMSPLEAKELKRKRQEKLKRYLSSLNEPTVAFQTGNTRRGTVSPSKHVG